MAADCDGGIRGSRRPAEVHARRAGSEPPDGLRHLGHQPVHLQNACDDDCEDERHLT